MKRLNLTESLDTLGRLMKECITCENTAGGILEDVESIISIVLNEYGVDEPCVWIVQHPTITAPGAKATISNTLKLQTSFEFVCVEYDSDPEVAQQKGQNLATRVLASVEKNWRRIQKEYNAPVISSIHFNTFLPVGEISIEGKMEKVPATSIVIDVIHTISWMNCCKKKNKN